MPWSGDPGAGRLLARVTDACAAQEPDDFPARLEAGLRAALAMLAADPDLARLLTVDPYLGAEEAALDAQQEWIARFGDLLRRSADADPRTRRPGLRFIPPFLIGGVRFQIARLVLSEEAAELPRLLPSLLGSLLSYYFEPGEPRALARAALDG